MFSRPRHHGPGGWQQCPRGDFGVIAGGLARLLDERNEQGEWHGAPPRPFRRTRDPRQWRPYFYGPQRREAYWSRRPPGAGPWVSRPRTLPRRGPPVAAIRLPHWFRHDVWEKRRPRGNDPRGPLRGGPARSANDPQTPPKISRSKTNNGRAGKAAEKARPTVVTVDKGGRERKWGPLSRSTAWKAGSYWEDMGGDAKIFLEKDGKRSEMSVEKVVGKGGPRFWFKDMKPDPQPQRQQRQQRQQPEEDGEGSTTEEVADGSTTEEEGGQSIAEEEGGGRTGRRDERR